MDTIASLDNIEIIYNTTAKELIKEGDRVVAVKAQDRAGNVYTVRANKGIILSTGGFAGNAAMVQQYNTSGKWPDLSRTKSTNLPAMTGDGLVMAQAIGAAVRDMDQIQLLQVCSPVTGKLHANVYPQSVAGYLFLNKEGRRFTAEDGRRDDISVAALKQTEGVFYLIQSGESIPDPDNASDLARIPLADLIESGDILVADTLAEVCARAGIDAAEAQRTIDAYNLLVDQKASQDEFGRRLLTIKLETGPWYVIPRAPSVHHTMGGLVINESCQVLDTRGPVIPGLFAAGEIVGGVHGANRLGGNAVAETVVFGRLAGNSASK
jgi:flavocytochrome c